jgi:DNA-binding MarR family transcriptional regulator
MADACNETSLQAWLALIRVYDQMHRHASEHLECYDLTPAQYDVLAQLQGAPGISQQELAERLMVTKGNICTLIDRMEKRNLVERRHDTEDRRINLLYLTGDGERIAAKAIPEYGRFVREHLSPLSEEKQRELMTLLKNLESHLLAH